MAARWGVLQGGVKIQLTNKATGVAGRPKALPY